MDYPVHLELQASRRNSVLHNQLPRNRTTKSVEILSAAREAIMAGVDPIPISEGEGGTYRLRDRSGSVIAVYKPCDEEPMGVNCPKTRRHSEPSMRSEGKGSNGRFKEGIEIHEAATREVAAYLLDHGNAAGVPWTTLATCTSRAFFSAEEEVQKAVPSPKTKVGALQQFISDTDAASNFGVSLFSAKEVHNIGLLDMRILNCDRHDGNILVKQDADTFHLVPIDHGYSLPDTMVVKWYEWTWLDWPQAKVPFDSETKKRVASIDIRKDVNKLRNLLHIRDPCIRTYRLATTFVKLAVARGLNLYQIATSLCRLNEDTPSELENIIKKAEDLSAAGAGSKNNKKMSKSTFYLHFVRLSREHISTLIPPSEELSMKDIGSVAYGDINYSNSMSSSDGETDYQVPKASFYERCHKERQEFARTKICAAEATQRGPCSPIFRPVSLRLSLAALESERDILPSVMDSPYCPDALALESNCPEVA